MSSDAAFRIKTMLSDDQELDERRAKVINTESLEEADPLELAEAYQCLGDILDERLLWDDATKYYQLALRIFEENTPGSYEIAMIHTNLGLAAEKQGKHASALQHQQTALNIYSNLDTSSVDVADTCCYIGNIYKQHYRDLSKAHQFYKQASIIYEIKKQGSVDLATTYYNLGVTTTTTTTTAAATAATTTTSAKGTEDARESFGRALEILKREAPDSLPLAHTHYALGCSYKIEALDIALDHYERALEIYQSQLPGSLVLACTYKNHGDIMRQLSYHGNTGNQPTRSEMACDSYHQALEIYQKILLGYS